MGIRIEKIAPEKEARDLVVEAGRVVPDADRSGPVEPTPDFARKLALGNAPFLADLRRHPRQKTALWAGQIISRRPGIKHVPISLRIKVHVRPNACKLRGPVPAAVEAEGFEVIPVEGSAFRHAKVLRRESRQTVPGCSSAPPQDAQAFRRRPAEARAPATPPRAACR